MFSSRIVKTASAKPKKYSVISLQLANQYRQTSTTYGPVPRRSIVSAPTEHRLTPRKNQGYHLFTVREIYDDDERYRNGKKPQYEIGGLATRHRHQLGAFPQMPACPLLRHGWQKT